MATAKEDVRKILEQLPDDASLEEIQHHIYLVQKIERGRKDIAEERAVSHEEVVARVSKWLPQ